MKANKQKTISERCIEHLEIMLGVPVDLEKLRFNPGKKQIVIDDIQLFHEIAQASQLSEVRRGHSSTWYTLNVPDGFKDGEDYSWVVALPSHFNQDFLKNYGGGYRFR
jgi:hypothetical protein